MLPCKRSWETHQGSMYLKPTERCNLQCRHCYVESRAEVDMSLAQLEVIFEKVACYMSKGRKSRIRFIWHGGEPMLMGPEYYQHAYELKERIFNKQNIKVGFSLQTNMLLVDKSWVQTIKTVFNNGLGTSFDWGIRDLGGSWEEYRDYWLDKYRFVRENKLRVGGVIMVVNRETIDKEKDIYRFFKKLPGTGLDTYPYVPLGCGEKNSDEYALKPLEYARFLTNLSDIYLKNLAEGNNGKTGVSIPILLKLCQALLTDKPASTIWTGSCAYSNLVVNPDGNVYGCPHFAGVRINCYGNIYSNTLQEILNSPNRQKAIKRQVFIPPQCAECEFLTTCGGGCLAHLLAFKSNLSEPDPLCDDYKRVFRYLKEALYSYGITNIEKFKSRFNISHEND